MADYDNVDIHVAIHTNGWQGDCYGSGCPRGTATYYDSSPSMPSGGHQLHARAPSKPVWMC